MAQGRRRERAAGERRALLAVLRRVAEGADLARILDVAARLARGQEGDDERAARRADRRRGREVALGRGPERGLEGPCAPGGEALVALDAALVAVDVGEIVPDPLQRRRVRARQELEQLAVDGERLRLEVAGQRADRGAEQHRAVAGAQEPSLAPDLDRLRREPELHRGAVAEHGVRDVEDRRRVGRDRRAGHPVADREEQPPGVAADRFRQALARDERQAETVPAHGRHGRMRAARRAQPGPSAGPHRGPSASLSERGRPP